MLARVQEPEEIVQILLCHGAAQPPKANRGGKEPDRREHFYHHPLNVRGTQSRTGPHTQIPAAVLGCPAPAQVRGGGGFYSF